MLLLKQPETEITIPRVRIRQHREIQCESALSIIQNAIKYLFI